MPPFPLRAEFALERLEYKEVGNINLPGEKVLYEYIYDYNANALIMVKNKNGLIDVEYYYYASLTKATYYQGEYCVVSNISQNSDMGKFEEESVPHRSLLMSVPRWGFGCAIAR